MSATSCKCTVSFNSKEKNDIMPIAMSKTELLALNENITNTTYEIMKTKLLNDTYPVGSIYMSTEDDTVDKVQTKFGGTWVKYASGTTLLSVDDDHEINSTGGASSVKLSTGNIPSLSVTGTTNNTGSGYTIGYGSSSRAVSSWSGAHSHQENDQIWTNTAPTVGGSHYVARGTSGNYMTVRTNGGGMRAAIYTANTTLTVSGQTVSDYYANKITGVESHNHSFTGNYTNSSQTDVDIQNPYTAVYMYKRTA